MLVFSHKVGSISHRNLNKTINNGTIFSELGVDFLKANGMWLLPD